MHPTKTTKKTKSTPGVFRKFFTKLYQLIRKAFHWLHHFYLRYLYKRDTILATISVFLVIGLLGLIPINTGILNPFKTALKDLDFNDISYSVLKKNAGTPIDNRIIIVNIGNADRMGLALMIEKLRAAKPKAIGLDVEFNGPREPEKDSLMRYVVSNTPELVLASRLDWKNKTEPLDVGYFGIFTKNSGYVNLIGEDGGTIRYFSPFEKANDRLYKSFPAAIAEKANKEAFQHLLQRKRAFEVIHYTRTIEQYMVLDGEDVIQDNIAPELLKDKIILMGYINADPYNVEDKHYTPLNKKFAGKSTPDMYGIIIHANIISMILDANYIREIPTWLFWIITILIAWLHVALFMRYYIEDHIWFHLVAKLAQIFFAILSVYIGIVFFDWFSIKIDTKISLIVIILAIDIIYFYEALAVWLHTKFGFHTNFHSKAH
ncbi:CHASE2 domain-containing sensor protein [Lacibacter cauensis]|uniref:CHASE2 domain-containing sensor protein n=1 Tax=Lacibacter cauensis TaxID=510947 RepID=A0A562SH80_9BACT|nr:CHASE2 domain-containing protein [Lacibacter cauensis]TWI80508.1 CHASE2 domain-containing sensor protein [Lacibacter cauensis]